MADSLQEALEALNEATAVDSTYAALVINNDLRTITVPPNFIFGVYNDKNVLSIDFEMPRYYDDIDLSTFSIQINYLAASNVGNIYEVENPVIEEDRITFEWLLDRGVFLKAGDVTFIVCLRLTGEGGTVIQEFNTTVAKGKVLDGLEVEDPEDPEAYSIIAHLREIDTRVTAQARQVATDCAAIGSIAAEAQEALDEANAGIAEIKEKYGSPLVAPTASGMLDHNRIYVYTGSETGYTFGNWHYWDGTAWTSGGVYNSAGVNTDSTLSVSGMPADAKKTGDEISGLKEDLDELPDNSRTDAENVDLDITDENGNSIVRFANGGIQTKEFNSSEVKVEVEELEGKVENVVAYEIGKNMLDPDKLVVGGLQSNGSISTTDSWASYKTSDYIPIAENTDYTFSVFPSSTNATPSLYARVIAQLYDEVKAIVADSYQNVSSGGVLHIHSGSAKYVRVCASNQYRFQLEIGETYTNFNEYDGKNVMVMNLGASPMAQTQSGNILYGKKWAVCGDSFTDGATSSKITDPGLYNGMRYVYPYLIGNRNYMQIKKFFNGGQTLAFPAEPGTFTNSLTNPNGANYYQNIPEDVDYITIYLGINDANHSSGSSQDGEETTGYIPLGEITDATTVSYYGAWNVVLTWLISNRPHAHIGIIVTNGNSNDDYRQAQIAIAKKYGLPYIDLNGDERTPSMHRTSNPDIASAVKTALLEKWRVSSSNTHPNDAAHLFESTFIENFLRSI